MNKFLFSAFLFSITCIINNNFGMDKNIDEMSEIERVEYGTKLKFIFYYTNHHLSLREVQDMTIFRILNPNILRYIIINETQFSRARLENILIHDYADTLKRTKKLNKKGAAIVENSNNKDIDYCALL